ncbi:MAG TPA: hypothetical protein VGR76_17070, partial [Candidatus Angelobacter sp.]|nr:hypothetical protein [Candidatus Angelobacter sp.]
MPVTWAFPAAQGEPESFLAVQGSICSLLSVLHFAIVKSIICSMCSTNFFCTLKKLSTPSGRLRPLTTSVGGVLPDEIVFLRRTSTCTRICSY